MAKLNKNYAIIKINDIRIENQKKIQSELISFNYHTFKCIDGHNEEDVRDFFKDHPSIKETRRTRAGYLGHWLSFLNALYYIIDNNLESLLVLEDDAILSTTFIQDLELYMEHVPDDYDFFAVYQFLPHIHNSEFPRARLFSKTTTHGQSSHNFGQIHSDWQIGSKYVVRSYQNVGSAGYIFSSAGAKKIISLTEQNGLGKNRFDSNSFRNFDRTIYNYSFQGLLSGYQPSPYSNLKKLITVPHVTGEIDTLSQTHKTPYVFLDQILIK
jgi:GR25 family glycosyltransferase involved in LPS biosynthesis